jgi:hypothetical protein
MEWEGAWIWIPWVIGASCLTETLSFVRYIETELIYSIPLAICFEIDVCLTILSGRSKVPAGVEDRARRGPVGVLGLGARIISCRALTGHGIVTIAAQWKWCCFGGLSRLSQAGDALRHVHGFA